jgi:hypothetical protein
MGLPPSFLCSFSKIQKKTRRKVSTLEVLGDEKMDWEAYVNMLG